MINVLLRALIKMSHCQISRLQQGKVEMITSVCGHVWIASRGRLVLVLKLLLGLLLRLLFVFCVFRVWVSGLLQVLAMVDAVRIAEGVWEPDVELPSSRARTKPCPSLVCRYELSITFRMFATVHDSIDARVGGVLAQEPSHPWRVSVASDASVITDAWPTSLPIGPGGSDAESFANFLTFHFACVSREATVYISSLGPLDQLCFPAMVNIGLVHIPLVGTVREVWVSLGSPLIGQAFWHLCAAQLTIRIISCSCRSRGDHVRVCACLCAT